MKKKLLSLFAGASLLVPTLGFAVGLGSVRTYSHLNEKLKAEIPVLSVKKQGKMTVSLASNAEFSRRGVQRSDILNSLNFALVERGGRYYVNVSSKEQIAVPYLNFIIRLNTPEGVVSREYAIFLDPVGNTQKKTSKKQSVNTSPYRASKSTASKNTSRKQIAPAPKRTASGVKVSSAKSGRYGPVRRGETLWSIASHTRPSAKVSVHQMISAIKRANPRTLSNGLPAGATLVIPTIEGYAPYAGGYAPMPTAIKKAKTTIKKKTIKQTVKPKTVKSKPKKVAKKADVSKSKENVAQDKNPIPQNETVARPQISQEQPIPKERELVQKLNSDEQANNGQLVQVFPNGEATASKETLVQQLADEGKEAAKAGVNALDNAGNAVADAGKGALATVGEGLRNTGEEIKGATEMAVDKTKAIAEGTVEKTGQLIDDAGKAVGSAVDTTKEALTPNDTTPIINEPEQAVTKPVEPVVNTEKAKTVTEAPKPAVKAQPQESGLMDKVIDFAPYIGGTVLAVLAGLAGFFLWSRRRKSESTDVVPLTEADMAELMGEDNIDELQTLDDNIAEHIDGIDDDLALGDATHSLAPLTDEVADKDFEVSGSTKVDADDSLVEDVFTDLDDNLDMLAEDDDVFADLDDAIINDVAHKTDDADLNAEQDTLSDEDIFADLNDVTDVDLPSDNSLPFDLGETTNDKVESAKELDDDLGLAFDLDDEKSEDLFKPIDLEGADKDFEVSEDFDFDLTDGDDVDGLLALDESELDTTVEKNDGGLDFNLEEMKDNVVEKVGDVKQATTDKVEDFNLSLADKVNDVKETASNNAENAGLSLSNFDDTATTSAADATKIVSPNVVSRMRMKMDLANSFISIGEDNRAKELLSEIIEGGNEEQVTKAKELLSNLG